MATNTITLKVDLAPEVTDLLKAILVAISDNTTARVAAPVAQEAPAAAPVELHPVQDPFPAPEAVQAPAEPVVAAPAVEPTDAQTPWEEPAPSAAPEKVYSLEDVRTRVMELSRKGSDVKAKVKAALNKYAASVPQLKAEQYGAFMADLEGIA